MDDPVKNSSTVNPFNSWHGIDRNLIDWHPVIDESKSIGCGMCATSSDKNKVQKI